MNEKNRNRIADILIIGGFFLTAYASKSVFEPFNSRVYISLLTLKLQYPSIEKDIDRILKLRTFQENMFDWYTLFWVITLFGILISPRYKIAVKITISLLLLLFKFMIPRIV